MDYIDRHARCLRDGNKTITMDERFEMAEALELMYIELTARRNAMGRIGSLLRSVASTPLVKVLPQHIAALIAQVEPHHHDTRAIEPSQVEL